MIMVSLRDTAHMVYLKLKEASPAQCRSDIGGVNIARGSLTRESLRYYYCQPNMASYDEILDDPVNRTFAWWSAVLTLKILLMVPLIGRHRFAKKIFISPEDTKFVRGSKVSLVDPDIERVRRAHLNDLESILPWAISTILWLTTSPDPSLAATLIKTFAICRILHTFVYAIYPIRQPARFLAFVGGCVVTFYQTLATIYYYS